MVEPKPFPGHFIQGRRFDGRVAVAAQSFGTQVIGQDDNIVGPVLSSLGTQCHTGPKQCHFSVVVHGYLLIDHSGFYGVIEIIWAILTIPQRRKRDCALDRY